MGRENDCTSNLARDLLFLIPVKVIERLTMNKPMKMPPVNISDWVEFCWLLLIDPTFQASRNKRKAYFDYRLAKQYNIPFC